AGRRAPTAPAQPAGRSGDLPRGQDPRVHASASESGMELVLQARGGGVRPLREVRRAVRLVRRGYRHGRAIVRGDLQDVVAFEGRDLSGSGIEIPVRTYEAGLRRLPNSRRRIL